MLFDGLPAVQILKLAFKVFGHSKLTIVNDCVHQAFPDKSLREDVRSWETLPPAVPPGSSHHSKFINIFALPYISIILSALSKSVTTKMCEIKYEKNTTPCCMSNACDPAKRDAERTIIELDMLDFRTGAERALPAHRGLMGSIAASFLGTRGDPARAWAVAHSPRVWGLDT